MVWYVNYISIKLIKNVKNVKQCLCVCVCVCVCVASRVWQKKLESRKCLLNERMDG